MEILVFVVLVLLVTVVTTVALVSSRGRRALPPIPTPPVDRTPVAEPGALDAAPPVLAPETESVA